MIELGPFQLDRPIGKGGMGEVWRAVHPHDGRRVAIKLLTTEAARDPSFQRAFRNEVRAAAALEHPHLVEVYDYGEVLPMTARASQGALVVGTPWLAMELVDGGTLHPWAGRLSWEQVHDITLALLDALGHAHARGVIHRDLKPGNVLVAAPNEGRWTVKLTDFGLAHAVDGAMQSEDRPFVGGTPSYMAPEQFDGHWRDDGPWTDLYSLGCLIFALVRGQPPFGITKSYEEKRLQHLFEPVPPLMPPMPVPSGFEPWLRRMLSKDPSARFRRAADAAWAFAALGPPEVVSAMLPSARPTDVDTLVLPMSALPLPKDATTLQLDRLPSAPEAGGAPIWTPELLGDLPVPPRDWRRPDEEAGRTRLAGAGLGLFGLRTLPLVGREKERDALWEGLLEVVDDGVARGFALVGPAGSGKSQLAEWLCTRAHEVGAVTVMRAHHGPIPGPGHGLGPMVARFLRCQGYSRAEVLERVEAQFRAAGVDHPDEWLALTELIVPAASTEAGAIRFGSPRERYVTLRRLIQAVALERPVLLWLDDVQWGLDALRFVAYLLERQGRAPLPVFLLLTATDEALAERRDEAAALAELVQREDVGRLPIGSLPRSSLGLLLEDLLGLDGELARRVGARCAGNPLFAVQLVGDWVQRGVLISSPGGFRLRTGAEVELPEDVHALWRDRIERVLAHRSAGEGLALELAAVLGTEVDPDEWMSVCFRASLPQGDGTRVQADPSEALLADLLDQRLARAGEGGPSQGWSFSHAMLRETLEHRARQRGRLQQLHRICADLLADQASVLGQPPAELAERLGRHLLASGQGEAALEPLRHAAAARVTAGDYPVAQSLLDRRDEALRALGVPGADERWGRGWQVRYDIAVGLADYEGASRWLDRLDRAARRYGWKAIEAFAMVQRGRRARIRGVLDHALDALRLGAQAADSLGLTQLSAEARAEMGEVLSEQGDLVGADRAIREALRAFERINDPLGEAKALQGLGEVKKESGDTFDALVLLRKAEGRFEKVGSRWGMASAINSQGDVCRFRGDFGEAEGHYRRARGLLRAIGSGSWVFPEFNLGLVAIAQGQSERGRPLVERALQDFTRQENRTAITVALLALACCAADQGGWLLWDDHFGEAQSLLKDTGSVLEDVAHVATLAGEHARRAGDVDRARQAYELALTQWQGLGRTQELTQVARVLQQLR